MDLFCDLHRIAITEAGVMVVFRTVCVMRGRQKKTRHGGRVASLFDFFNHVVTS